MPMPKVTLAEFEALPETEPASEWIDGEVIQKSMPPFEHGFIQSALSLVIGLFLQANRLGFIGSEVRCIFGPQGGVRPYVPDLIYIDAARLRQTGRGQPLRGAPDLAVEIMSPDDRPDRVAAKVAFYLLYGVRLVWLIDPDARAVTVLKPDGRSTRLTEADQLDGGDVLPGFSTPMYAILLPELGDN